MCFIDQEFLNPTKLKVKINHHNWYYWVGVQKHYNDKQNIESGQDRLLYAYSFIEKLKWKIIAECSSMGDYILYFPGVLSSRWTLQITSYALCVCVKMGEIFWFIFSGKILNIFVIYYYGHNGYLQKNKYLFFSLP